MVYKWYSNVHDRGNSSKTVPWPMLFRQWPQSQTKLNQYYFANKNESERIRKSMTRKQLLNVTCARTLNALLLNASEKFVQLNAHQSESHVDVQLHHHPAKRFGTCNVSAAVIQYLSQKMWTSIHLTVTPPMVVPIHSKCSQPCDNVPGAITARGGQCFRPGQSPS